MGSVLFPLFKTGGMSAEKAWRTVCIVPACVGFIMGIITVKNSDDCPKGNYADLKKHGSMAEIYAAASFRTGAFNINTWLLFIQYGCSFGVELTMNNAAAMYFATKFDLTTEKAAAIASLFGWMNLFARGVGGYCSDKANAKIGMRGRLIFQTLCLCAEGVMVFIFANTESLGIAIFLMVIFSSFVQAAEGSTYGIVPYVNPPATGSIARIVGAGGNTGAVCFGLGFRNLGTMQAFYLMASCICVSGVLSIFICIKGHAGLLTGKDSPEVIAAYKKSDAPAATTLEIPQADANATVKLKEGPEMSPAVEGDEA